MPEDLKDRWVARIERVDLGPHTETIIACFFGALFALIAFAGAWFPTVGAVAAGIIILVIFARTVAKWRRGRAGSHANDPVGDA